MATPATHILLKRINQGQESKMSDQDIQQFMALTNASVNVAQQYLEEFGTLGVGNNFKIA